MVSQGLYVIFFNCAFPQRNTIAYLIYICSLILLFQNFKSKNYDVNSGKTNKEIKPKNKTDQKKNK